MNEVYDVIIIGSGPAGLTAAIYNARADLNTLVLGGLLPGGQLRLTTRIENYPGFVDEIEGPKLVDAMLEQAKRLGSNIEYKVVDKVDFSVKPLKVFSGSDIYSGKSVIIASGSSARYLGLPKEKQFISRGVSVCATCDGAFFRNKVVAVVGGGDTAMEYSLTLCKLADQIYVIHRRDQFRACEAMQKRVLACSNVKVVWNSEVREILGDQKVEGIKIQNNKDKSEKILKLDGVFLAIGHIPNTSFLEGQLELDENKYVVSKDGIHTSVEGVFVAGDVYDHVYQQAIYAAGMGCRAGLEAERYIRGS